MTTSDREPEGRWDCAAKPRVKRELRGHYFRAVRDDESGEHKKSAAGRGRWRCDDCGMEVDQLEIPYAYYTWG